MQSKRQKIIGRILSLSVIGIIILGFIVSLFIPFKDNIDAIISFWYILGTLLTLSLVVLTPIGVVILTRKEKYIDFNPFIELKDINTNSIYTSYFDISELSKKNISKIKKHNFGKQINPRGVVVLNLLTFGTFKWFLYRFAHSDLPRIRKCDFGAEKAIGYLFIPFYGFYWYFKFWIRLINRINLQYKIRDLKTPISKGLTITTFIFKLIPYLNFIIAPIFFSILIYQIQSAINNLVDE